MATQISSALDQPNATRWIAVVVGLIGIVTTGRTLTKTLAAASCLAWRLPVRPKASMRATGAIVGLIVGVGLVSLLVNRIRAELGIAVAGVSFVVALAVYGVAWLLMLLTLPRATNDPSASLPGALVLALTLVGMQAISQLYLPDRFERASQLYGAIGTTIVVARLVLHHRAGDRVRDDAQRRHLRAVRRHLRLRLLAAGAARPGSPLAAAAPLLRPRPARRATGSSPPSPDS